MPRRHPRRRPRRPSAIASPSRRRFLCGAGGALLALPWLGTLGRRAWAEPATPPKRVLIVFTPNGTVESKRLTATGETDFAFGQALDPLTPWRERLLVLDGLEMASAELGPGDPHQRGMAHMLTGMPLEAGDLFQPFDSAQFVGWGTGISIDQRIADHLTGQTWLRSLEVGVQSRYRPQVDVWGVASYRGPGQPIAPIDDPRVVFRKCYGTGANTPEALDRLRARRRSVLDAVTAELTALRGQLGAEDRTRLDAHADAVRDIELRLDAPTAAEQGACVSGDPPALGDWDFRDPKQFEAMGELQMDLLVNAFRCDLTRVGSLVWSFSNGGPVFSDLGHELNHHGITHENWSDPKVMEKLLAIEQFYARQFATLLNKLASVPEGDGTLLDHTLVFWTQELNDGYTHSHLNMPYMLAGGEAFGMKTGRRLVFQNRSHLALLGSVQQFMGLGDTAIGHPDYASPPLEGLS